MRWLANPGVDYRIYFEVERVHLKFLENVEPMQ